MPVESVSPAGGRTFASVAVPLDHRKGRKEDPGGASQTVPMRNRSACEGGLTNANGIALPGMSIARRKG
jgi:hypothetical protein